LHVLDAWPCLLAAWADSCTWIASFCFPCPINPSA
jgi:hypothetical protein